jgi:protein subunit release factor A
VSKKKASGGKKELLFSVTRKDLDIQTFTAGGPGGQHQNTSNTAVRIKHRPSGAVGEARDSRSQHQNMRAALLRMTESGLFKAWVNRKVLGDKTASRGAGREGHGSGKPAHHGAAGRQVEDCRLIMGG